MCVLFTRLHYFDGEDLPEEHHTRFYDDKSRDSALSTGQLQRALDRLSTSLQTNPKFCSFQDKTNSVLWMSMESKWRTWSSSGSNDGRLTDVLAHPVQFYERFFDQWSLKMSLVGRGCWTSSSHLCSPTMDNDEYELIVEKRCNCDSSQFNHTKAESLLLDMKRSQVRWLAHQLFHKEKHVHVELIARLCQQRFDLTWADVIASVKDRTQSKCLHPKREEQMKTKLALSFSYSMPLFTCQSIFYHEKMQTNVFIFSQPNLLHFQTIHFHFHTQFISKFRFRIQLERRNSACFFLLPSNQKCFLSTYHKKQIVALFLNWEKEFLFTHNSIVSK